MAAKIKATATAMDRSWAGGLLQGGQRGRQAALATQGSWEVVVLVAGWAATLVALYFNFNGKVALYALIPIAIGLHYLIYYFAIGRKEAAALEAERAAKAGQTGRDPVS